MTKPIRIGSRDSSLATWQAKEVQKKLASINIPSEIVFIKSIGDLEQDKPLTEIGTVGVFTKALDEALLQDKIDIAVHSCKDLPSKLHSGLQLCAYLEREDDADVLVGNNDINFLDNHQFHGTIATGSVRRKAQLLHRFPKATITGLRGNVPTRLQKLRDNGWDGAVFAYAGLKRLGIEPEHYQKLDFFVPAPAQGVVAVACRTKDKKVYNTVQKINHRPTEITTLIERRFLHLMEGGCISPIGANAVIKDDEIHFAISVLATDGSKKVEFTEVHPKEKKEEIAEIAFKKAKQLGAKRIIEEIEEQHA